MKKAKKQSPWLSIREKEKILSDYKKSGMTLKDFVAANELPIHPSTLCRWKKRRFSKKRFRRTTAIDMDALEKDLRDYPHSLLRERASRLGTSIQNVYNGKKRLHNRPTFTTFSTLTGTILSIHKKKFLRVRISENSSHEEIITIRMLEHHLPLLEKNKGNQCLLEGEFIYKEGKYDLYEYNIEKITIL